MCVLGCVVCVGLCCVLPWADCCVSFVVLVPCGGLTLFPVNCSPPSGMDRGTDDITIIRVRTSMDAIVVVILR